MLHTEELKLCTSYFFIIFLFNKFRLIHTDWVNNYNFSPSTVGHNLIIDIDLITGYFTDRQMKSVHSPLHNFLCVISIHSNTVSATSGVWECLHRAPIQPDATEGQIDRGGVWLNFRCRHRRSVQSLCTENGISTLGTRSSAKITAPQVTTTRSCFGPLEALYLDQRSALGACKQVDCEVEDTNIGETRSPTLLVWARWLWGHGVGVSRLGFW